jgi:hypothetical protein
MDVNEARAKAKAHPALAAIGAAAGASAVGLVSWLFIMWNGSIVYGGELANEMRPLQKAVEVSAAAAVEQTESIDRLALLYEKGQVDQEIRWMRDDRRERPAEWTDDETRQLVALEVRQRELNTALFDSITP